MLRKRMLETHYRASRVCRVLGNPTAYQIIKFLEKSAMTPSALAAKIGLSIKTISGTLRHLREVDLVRYETKDKYKIYNLKDKTFIVIFEALENYAEKIRHKKW